MILEDHSQEKIKEIENKLTRLDWDINTGYLSTKTHMPVGSGTSTWPEHYSQK
jgi:hypothetical protein